ncbi:hypothetical protein CKO51_02830 [Rhodopirellula sp. SM50]|nr:hypothetical protein CKO51_02830 [Rhodopirellula sp. SM50]
MESKKPDAKRRELLQVNAHHIHERDRTATRGGLHCKSTSETFSCKFQVALEDALLNGTPQYQRTLDPSLDGHVTLLSRAIPRRNIDEGL